MIEERKERERDVHFRFILESVTSTIHTFEIVLFCSLYLTFGHFCLNRRINMNRLKCVTHAIWFESNYCHFAIIFWSNSLFDLRKYAPFWHMPIRAYRFEAFTLKAETFQRQTHTLNRTYCGHVCVCVWVAITLVRILNQIRLLLRSLCCISSDSFV